MIILLVSADGIVTPMLTEEAIVVMVIQATGSLGGSSSCSLVQAVGKNNTADRANAHILIT